MPATAGRVRMPANNRVHSSAALQTHGIWQSAIGYDPYAPTNNSEKDAKPSANRSSVGEDGGENAYASFQGLLALARITGTNADDTRGACKKCGRVGHLTFQCRNFLSLKVGREKDETAADEAMALFHELKKGSGKKDEESEAQEEEEESSDSDLDPEIEKIIAARSGKKMKKESDRNGRPKKSSKRSRHGDHEEEEEEEEEEEDRGRRKEKRRKRKERRRYESSEDEDEERDRHRKGRKESGRSHKRRDISDDESDGLDCRKRRNRRKDDHSSDSDGIISARHHKRRRERRKERRRERRKERRRASPSDSDTSGSGYDVDAMEKKSSGRRSRRIRKD